MKYRKFGSLDYEVSALGFGAMRLPKKKFLFWNRLDESEAIRIIRHGIDLGINYVDTAFPYHGGKSEIVVGKALQDGYREKAWLVTKCPMWKVKAREDYRNFLTEQLQKLQTDHLDIYLFHGLNRKRFELIKELDLIKEAEKARDEGLIRHIGFSFHDAWPVFKDIIDYYDGWEMAQIQYNYMDTGIQATTQGLEYAAGKGIAVVIMEPVKGGKLANPPKEVLEIFTRIPKKRTPVDWALQFLWNRPEVACVLSGMGSQQMVDENCASADNSGIGTLEPAETAILEEIAGLFRKLIVVPCTACEYCMPCPQGVNIPRNFEILNNFSRDKNRKRETKAYKKLAKSAQELNTAKDNGNASLCIECAKCTKACPQEIDIPAQLKKVRAIFEEGKEISEFF